MQRRIAIFGATGSIGTSTLAVVRHLGPAVRVTALSTHTRQTELAAAVEQFRPAVVVVTGGEPTDLLRQACRKQQTQILLGPEALCDVARSADVDTVVHAVVGAAGVRSAHAAVSAGKTLALANKESLVVAGSILMPLARQTGASILPIDSEHSAILQCLASGRASEVQRIVLTSSGGPFRTVPVDVMRRATAEAALNHPVWRMGKKITIDSATMFNKALEIVEAAQLFDIPGEKIDVVLHPQSVVHSMVEFVDGSTIAQLSPPDMKTPIQFALSHPRRWPGVSQRMDWTRPQRLDFEPADREKFPSIEMAYEAVRAGGTLPAVMNAANEAAVAAFLRGEIRLGEIFSLVRDAMSRHRLMSDPALDDLLEADSEGRSRVNERLPRLNDRLSGVAT
jgi:1-deoxy-D-xylulose-5-phosphate reductoisomerase